MKKNKNLGWLAALTMIAGTCLWTNLSANPEPYMTDLDKGCTGATYICGVVEG